MLRFAVCAAIMLTVPACSEKPTEENEDFRPPVVEARGDFLARQERRFERLDKDTDGKLVAAEFPQRRPERVAQLDGDKNGQVSHSEFIEGNIKRFDAMDVNKDADLSPEERVAARQD